MKDQDDCDTSFSKVLCGQLGVLSALSAMPLIVSCLDRTGALLRRAAAGHHAGLKGLIKGATSCGFCIFNNVAAGASTPSRLVIMRCPV